MTRRPSSVVDLGIGMGFYGAVVCQWLDLGVRPWRTCLVGVEGFAGYRNPCWELYDQVIVAPIEEFLTATNSLWDAILLLDVLEHFEHAQGEQVLGLARNRLSPAGRLYVGTPAIWMEQAAVYGNEFECHRSLWTAQQLGGVALEVIEVGRAIGLGTRCYWRWGSAKRVGSSGNRWSPSPDADPSAFRRGSICSGGRSP